MKSLMFAVGLFVTASAFAHFSPAQTQDGSVLSAEVGEDKSNGGKSTNDSGRKNGK